jgi:hypothetical protein
MLAITIHTDEALTRMWTEHLAAERAADVAGQGAADLERDADQYRAEAATLQGQATAIINEAERRATEILNEAQQRSAETHKAAQVKDEAAVAALNQSVEARREEKRQRDIAQDFAATVDSQAELNSNLTHPKTRQKAQQEQTVNAFSADPLHAPYTPDPEQNGTPQLASDLPGARVAPNGPWTQAMPATPPSAEQAP